MHSRWRNLSIISVISFGFWTNHASGQSIPTTKPIRFTIEYQGKEREYFIRLPKTFNANKTYWGLVTAHGGGRNGQNHWLAKDIWQAIDEVGLKAIMISPSFSLEDPNAQSFPVLGGGQFLKNILEVVRKKYELREKILLTGYSRGAQFAHRFALLNPGMVRASAPLASGTWTTPDGRFFLYSFGEVPEPKMFFHHSRQQ